MLYLAYVLAAHRPLSYDAPLPAGACWQTWRTPAPDWRANGWTATGDPSVPSPTMFYAGHAFPDWGTPDRPRAPWSNCVRYGYWLDTAGPTPVLRANAGWPDYAWVPWGDLLAVAPVADAAFDGTVRWDPGERRLVRLDRAGAFRAALVAGPFAGPAGRVALERLRRDVRALDELVDAGDWPGLAALLAGLRDADPAVGARYAAVRAAWDAATLPAGLLEA